MKLDSEKLYEKFKRIYDESVIRNVDKVKVEDRLWNRGQRKVIPLLLVVKDK